MEKARQREYSKRSYKKFLATASPQEIAAFMKRRYETTRKWLNDPAHPERKEKQRQGTNRWYWENRDRCLAVGKIKRERVRQSLGDLYPLKRRFENYVARSKKVGLEFCLSFEEFLKFIARPCFYCLRVKAGGIDRIDNSVKGYAEARNLVPCCFTCNRMKGKLSTVEFLNQCRMIVKQHSK